MHEHYLIVKYLSNYIGNMMQRALRCWYSSDMNSLFSYRLSTYNHISQPSSIIKKGARNSPSTFQAIPKITSSRKNKCILRFWRILPFLIQVKKP